MHVLLSLLLRHPKLHSLLAPWTAGMLLAFALPSATALPVTDSFHDAATHTFFGSAGFGGDGASISTDCISMPPTDLLGTVVVEISVLSQIAVTNADPLGFPMNNTFINWTPNVMVMTPDGTSVFVFGNTHALTTSSPGTVSLNACFTDSLFLTFSGAAMAGSGPLLIHMGTDVTTGTDFGFGQHTAAFQATITYSAPDTAPTVWLIGLGLVALGCRRRYARHVHDPAPF